MKGPRRLLPMVMAAVLALMLVVTGYPAVATEYGITKGTPFEFEGDVLGTESAPHLDCIGNDR